MEEDMRDLTELFQALDGSAFRRRFHLADAELDYLRRKGLPTVLRHAREFITGKLAAAEPHKDGKQTPWKGHPVFVAQHATATCCRGCLAKWHHIEKGKELTGEEREYVAAVIERWLRIEAARAGTDRVERTADLFDTSNFNEK
jgi:hypothetical protein